MASRIRIAPSILAADFTRLGEEIQAAADGDLIHIDVMDGRFVPNITMGPLVVEAVRRVTTLPLDVHLMIVEPEQHLKAFAQAGADIISVHWETCPNLNRTIQTIHELGCRAGVAINPHIPAHFMTDILPLIETVLVMTVNPGFGGQSFLTETLPKLRQLRTMIDASGRDIALEVDGGISLTTASTAVQAGADTLVAGSSVFNKTHSISANIAALRQAAGI